MTPSAASPATQATDVGGTAEAGYKRASSLRRYLLWLLPANVAMCATYQGIQQILIPGQVAAIDPVLKVRSLGLITTIAAITSVIGLVAGGVVSDRTTGRWGRRAPSLAFGAAASAVLMAAMSVAQSLLALAWLFAALWFVASFYQGALTATLIDRVPPERRGLGSSIMASGFPLGILAGVNFAARSPRMVGYAGLATAFVLATAGLLLFAPEPPAPRAARAGNRRSPALRLFAVGLLRFLESFRSRNFTLAFVARALMFFAIFNVTGYTYYILQDHIGAAHLPGHDVQGAVAILISIQMIGCALSTAACGWLVDRWQRPKLFVAVSSIGVAGALFIPVLNPSWAGMVELQLWSGLFFGAYLAVDLALMTLVVPDHASGGRDMAILAVATGAPQILSPALSAAIIGQFGYQAVFLLGTLMALGAGVTIFFVKAIR